MTVHGVLLTFMHLLFSTEIRQPFARAEQEAVCAEAVRNKNERIFEERILEAKRKSVVLTEGELVDAVPVGGWDSYFHQINASQSAFDEYDWLKSEYRTLYRLAHERKVPVWNYIENGIPEVCDPNGLMLIYECADRTIQVFTIQTQTRANMVLVKQPGENVIYPIEGVYETQEEGQPVRAHFDAERGVYALSDGQFCLRWQDGLGRERYQWLGETVDTGFSRSYSRIHAAYNPQDIRRHYDLYTDEEGKTFDGTVLRGDKMSSWVMDKKVMSFLRPVSKVQSYYDLLAESVDRDRMAKKM